MLRPILLLCAWFGLLYALSSPPAPRQVDLEALDPDPLYCDGEPECAPEVVMREAKSDMPFKFVPPAWWCVVPEDLRSPLCRLRS